MHKEKASKKMELLVGLSLLMGTGSLAISFVALNRTDNLNQLKNAVRVLEAQDVQNAGRFCELDPEMIKKIPDPLARTQICDYEVEKKIASWEELLASPLLNR